MIVVSTSMSIVPISVFLSVLGVFGFFSRFFIRIRVFWPEFFILVFFLYFLLSVVFYYPNSFIEYGFYRYDGNFIISFLPMFCVFFFGVNKSKDFLYKALLSVAFIYFFVWLAWFLLNIAKFGGYGAFSGLHSARNAMGGYLSIVCFSSFLLYNFYKGKKGYTKRARYMFLSGSVFFVCLFSTYSRGSIVALFLVFLIYIFRRFKFLDLMIIFLLIVSTVFISVYKFNYNESYASQEKVLEKNQNDEREGQKSRNVTIRLEYLWPKSILMFIEKPIFGNGVGSFNEFNGYEPDMDIGDRDESFLKYNPSNAHNSFLNFMAEMGLVGVIIYLLFFLSVRNFCLKARSKVGVIADVAYYSYLLVVIASFSEHRLTTPSSMIIVSFLFSLLFSESRRTYVKEYKVNS